MENFQLSKYLRKNTMFDTLNYLNAIVYSTSRDKNFLALKNLERSLSL